MASIKRVLIFSTFFLVLIKLGYSQQDPEAARQYMEIAEEIMKATSALDDARENFVTAADLDTTFLRANFEAGHVYLLTINKERAVKYLLRVYRQDPNYRFDIEYLIGKSYQYGLEFDKAIRFYNLYKQRYAKKPNYQGRDRVSLSMVDRAIFECENGKTFVSAPGDYSIVNIGREINSEYDDYAPVLNENEDQIVFTSRRRDDNLNQNVADDNKPWEDIYIAYKKGGTWSAAKNIGAPVNTAYHNSNSALSADGQTLFLFNDENNGDIYFSELTNGKWTPPQPIPGFVNSSYEEKSVTISSDEKTLYFSSNRPGGYGGLDIYKATKDSKGNWSIIKNLGPKINTDQDDDGPFIDYDGVTLYFSSKGHKGMGGYDVYKSTFNPSTNEWSDPENLGYPINTPDNDIYFVTSKDRKRAYYSSVREDGMGYTDIYMVTIPDGLDNIKSAVAQQNVTKPKEEDTTASNILASTQNVTVTIPKDDPVKTNNPVKTDDAVKTNNQVANNQVTKPKETQPEKKPEPKTLQPLKFLVRVVDASDQSGLEVKIRMVGAKDNVIVASTAKGNGLYEFNVTASTAKDYRLSVERDGYAFQNVNLKLEGASEKERSVNRTIEMRKLSVGVTSVLRNIYFDFDKATFKTESYTELNKLEAMLRQNENLKVEIGGHTDGVGTKNYNIFLSRKRAEAVKDYLTKKGIDPRRITAVGYGKSKPLASNDDENEGRELNRRVEFKVLSN
jgi:outer membrane protein OmpA-like peptidoglycan-associated protein